MPKICKRFRWHVNTCTNASCPLTTTIYCLSSFFTPHFCEGLSDIFTIASTHSPKPQFSTSFCQGRGFMLRPPIGSELKIYIIPSYTLLVGHHLFKSFISNRIQPCLALKIRFSAQHGFRNCKCSP